MLGVLTIGYSLAELLELVTLGNQFPSDLSELVDARLLFSLCNLCHGVVIEKEM